MKTINIITVDNQSGLTRDALILNDILGKAGFKVSIFTVGKKTIDHKFHRLKTYSDRLISHLIKKQPPYDINIFLQDIIPDWFAYAKVNYLIPNQEWFRETSVSYLKQIDCVLCKTKEAQNIFDTLGCHTEFISFTGLDRWLPNISKNYDVFFHLAGSNPYQKGTKSLIDIWLQHPEWPTLIVRQKKFPFHRPASNINYLNNFIEDELLSEYQNTYGIHLCPSQSEGFGHYLVEAMSTQAIVMTTNAPPMNELITQARGFLIDYSRSEKQKFGTKYYIDPSSLEQQIQEIISLDHQTKKQISEQAREWYLENDRFFKSKIVALLANR